MPEEWVFGVQLDDLCLAIRVAEADRVLVDVDGNGEVAVVWQGEGVVTITRQLLRLVVGWKWLGNKWLYGASSKSKNIETKE